MTFNGWIQIAIYCVVIIALTKPLGGYLTRVFNGERTFLSQVETKFTLQSLRRCCCQWCRNCNHTLPLQQLQQTQQSG